MRFRRRELLPDAVRASLSLEPGERVIAAARVGGDGWLVATERALLAGDRRTLWTDVVHARWDDEQQVLAVDLAPGAGTSMRLALTDPGRLPETVHERVMASIVVTRRVPVPGGWVRVVGRDGGDGVVRWQVIADPGVDAAADDVRTAADSAVAALRAELGR